MKFTPKRFLTSILILSMMGITLNSLTSNSGPVASSTNAPGESNCTIGCHSGNLDTSGTNWDNISLSGNFTGDGYIPDSSYTITLSYSHSGLSKFGFQLTCLTSSNAMAGSFTNTSTETSRQFGSGSLSTRQYMQHTSSGTSGSNNSKSWSFTWTAPSNNVDSVTFYTIVNGANGNGANSGDVITAREFKVGPSSLLPEAIAGADTNVVCAGNPVAYEGSLNNGSAIAWQWSFPNGNPSASFSTSQNPSITYNIAGTYMGILRVKNAKGWSLPDTVDITITTGATSFINMGANQNICDGDSLKITANFFPGQAYLWNTGETGNIIYAKDSGEYYVTATHTNGCSKESNIINVTLSPKPLPTLSSNAASFGDTACANSTLLLSATPGFDSFYFYNNSMLISRGSADTAMTTFMGTTTYKLLVENSGGCFSDTIRYTVQEQAKLPAPQVVCATTTTTSVEFSWDDTGYDHGFEVSIDSGAHWIAPSSGVMGNTHLLDNLNAEQKVTLWVRALDIGACENGEIGKKTCTSDKCNSLNVSLSYRDTLCYGETVDVKVHGLKDAYYSLSFEGGPHFTDTTFSFDPEASGIYMLNVVDSNFLICPDAAIDVPVHVDRIYDMRFMADKPDAVYCEGDMVTLSANDSFDHYMYYINGVLKSDMSNSYTTSDINDGDSAFVSVMRGVCTASAEQIYFTVHPLPDASFTFTRQEADYTFIPSVSTHSAYKWYFGDGDSSSLTSPTHDYTNSSNSDVDVVLHVESDEGCMNSSMETISIPDFGSIRVLAAMGISVYPNPVSDHLTIQNKNGKPGKVYITDIRGKEVMNMELNGLMTELSLSELSSGFYMLEMQINNKTFVQKIRKN